MNIQTNSDHIEWPTVIFNWSEGRRLIKKKKKKMTV